MRAMHEDLTSMCRRALEDRETFWAEEAEKLVWTKKFTKVMDDSKSPFTKWFVGGELNLCYNCVDRHVIDGYGDKVAVLFDSPVSGTYTKYTFVEILDKVTRLAGALSRLGVSKGDMVMIYTPIIPEGAWSMLACARIGALHVCVPTGLTAVELWPKIQHAKPKIIIMSSHGYHCGIWLNYKLEMDLACDKVNVQPDKILVFHRGHMKNRVSMSAPRDVDFEELMTSSDPVPCVPMEANEPQFMIYTSGSTGTPKAIVHSAGHLAVRLICHVPLIFGKVKDDNVTFSTTYLGWIVGQTRVVYGPLLGRITTVFFEGDSLLTDDVRGLYSVLAKNRVTTSFIRPGVLKALKGMDLHIQVSKEFNLSRLKHIYCGGERTDMTTLNWVKKTFQAHVWNIWGQTESGSVLGAPDLTQSKNPPRVWEFGFPYPGWDLYVEKSDGSKTKENGVGKVLARLPLPPGVFLTVFGDDELCKSNYFKEYPGYFDTKDQGCLNEYGHGCIDCRTDDLMKIGSIYLAAQSLEEVIHKHQAVANCVVVSITDLIWKELPIALYTKVSGCIQNPKEIDADLKRMVRESFGTLIRFEGAILVEELPQTLSGKVHRPTCRAMVRGSSLQGYGGVENTHVFKDIVKRLQEANYGTNQLLD